MAESSIGADGTAPASFAGSKPWIPVNWPALRMPPFCGASVVVGVVATLAEVVVGAEPPSSSSPHAVAISSKREDGHEQSQPSLSHESPSTKILSLYLSILAR